MKITHVNHTSSGGGAAIAARRLNDAMKRAGMDSALITKTDFSDIYFRRSTLGRILEELKHFIYWRTHRFMHTYRSIKGTWSEGYGCNPWNAIPETAEADVIYLHWINHETLSIEEIGNLLDSGKRVVWFMHDMWPVAGGCHYALECEKYQSHCGACPMLESMQEKDLSYDIFERKMKCFTGHPNLTLVAPSKWLADCARSSRLFSGNRIEVIPNLIDTGIFHPVDREAARKVLNLPADKQLILFGCDGGQKSFYKGWSYLEDALQKLDLSKYELVVFGNDDSEIRQKFKTKIHFLGRLHDERTSLVIAYSAADVFVSPSIAENFSLTLCEASACGTPTVCFEVGGCPDIVLHKQTGYLAEYKNSADLARGIEWVLESNRDGHLSRSARERIINFCSETVVTEQHKKLLESFMK